MRRFLRNRSINVKLVDDPTVSTETDPIRDPFEGPEILAAYSKVAKDFITHAALTIGGVYAACKIIERICK